MRSSSVTSDGARSALGRCKVLGFLALSLPSCAGSARDESRLTDVEEGDASEMTEVASADADESHGGGEPEPVPCEGVAARTGPLASDGMATLRVALTQTAASGARYRLEGATFSLFRSPGDGAEYADMLSAADSADGDVIEVALPSGEYSVTLNDGWSVAAVGSDTLSTVPSARLSPSVLYLALEPGADVSVRFRFEVQVPGAALARANVAPTLGVLERPDAPSGRVCVESPIAPEGYVFFQPSEVAALEGCREVRGELYLGFESSADLRPLSELERVCGTLSLSSTAPFGLGPPRDEQSLAGLEALEEVDALFISHPGVRSLAPLSSLRRIQRRDVENDVLGLFVLGSSLEDLSGLEHVTEIQNVRVDGDASLRSLRGLRLPAEMHGLEVSGTNLADLSALAGVASVTYTLYVDAGAATDLSALSSLRRAASVSISGAALRDVTGLAGLERTGYFSLQGSPLEVELPVFSALTQVGDLNFSGLSAPGELSMPALGTATSLYIADNARLELVSLPALTRVGTLNISNNAALATLVLPVLSGAASITVVNNPALGPEQTIGLEALDVASRKIGGNAGSTLPLDPCPWAGDGFCDEGFYGVCAPGTDGDDCGAID
jgi:hypothetical protein